MPFQSCKSDECIESLSAYPVPISLEGINKSCMLMHIHNCKIYVIYVTWAGGIFLIYMHRSEGKCRPIRQIPTAHITYVMEHSCSWHSKNLPNLPFTVLPCYIMTGAVYGYGFLILTFLQHLLRYTV